MLQEKEQIYVLNPCYVLRNDMHRIVLFSRIRIGVDCSKDWHSFIHPLQAVLLSFFTYERTWQDNVKLLAEFFYRDVEYIEQLLSLYLENESPVYVRWNGKKIVLPKKILIKKEDAGSDFRFLQLVTDDFMCRKLDLDSRRLYTGPLLVTFMLTNRCVTHCRYCYADTKTEVTRPLSISRILSLIQEAADFPVQQVALMGGEIFLYPYWTRILKELVFRGIAPEYISTKVPLNRHLLKELHETGYKGIIQVSLDAISPVVLQKSLLVSERYWQQMEQGLRLLDQSGFNYQVATVVSTYNCDCHILTDLFRFLLTLEHLSDWRIVPVNDSLYVDPKEMKQLKPSIEQLLKVFDYLHEWILPTSPFPILLNESFRESTVNYATGGSRTFEGKTCSALNTHLFVLPDGLVSICEQLYWHSNFIIGDVTHSSLKEIWNSPRSLRLSCLTRSDIQETSACRNCVLFESCYQYRNRCWSDVIKKYGIHCWDFPDPRCQWAPT